MTCILGRVRYRSMAMSLTTGETRQDADVAMFLYAECTRFAPTLFRKGLSTSCVANINTGPTIIRPDITSINTRISPIRVDIPLTALSKHLFKSRFHVRMRGTSNESSRVKQRNGE
ncbi:hypothetical protein HBI56_031060 [Parastagonospora nodorum]|nr:hypothetical protein HBI09_103990 [Parastagonospora nodorum]KAH4910948.1 hypothetical protein HBI80_027460 [Parastagonospora nodorum]KAH4921340.1 hypothetical protein HBH74_125600 [Parastagonospora nodorum]KAH4929709.1 hypothetical protein HBH73_193470 [Parastagonospora nodorum]KAH5010308.1 hypothetical protein HBI77_089080 [Parastagonospora nodorum]